VKKKKTLLIKNHHLLFLLVLTAFFLYLLPPTDTDLGWHLRYGQHIFRNGSVWKTNQIGFFLPHYQWAHSYSLYQLLIFTIFHYQGFWGLAFLGALIMALTFFFLCRNYTAKFFWYSLGCIFLYLVSLPVTGFGLRSQLFSLLGISFLFSRLLSVKQLGRKEIILFPLLFVFWVNLHGGFVLGLFLLGFYLGEQIWQKKMAAATKTFFVGGLSFLATLANPFGWHIWEEIWRHSWYPLNKLIAEWTPPTGPSLLLIIFSIILIALGFLLSPQPLNFFHKDKSLFLSLSWLFFLFLAMKAKRHLPFFGFASFHLFFKLYRPPSLSFWPKIPLAILCGGIIINKLFHLPHLALSWETIRQYSRTAIPHQAVEFLQKNPQLCHQIYNAYEWGGYLAWHLPSRKIFVDGRMPAWPTPEKKSPYTIYLEIIQARPGFEKRLKNYGADCLLIARGTFLDLELRKNPRQEWLLIYQDQVASLYQRND